MANKQETVEEVTVKTPEKVEEEVKETVTGTNPAPAANPAPISTISENPTNEEVTKVSESWSGREEQAPKDWRVEGSNRKGSLANNTAEASLPETVVTGENQLQQPQGQFLNVSNPDTQIGHIDVETPKGKTADERKEEVKESVTMPEETFSRPNPRPKESPKPQTRADILGEETPTNTEAGSEENAEGVAEELQSISPDEIPTDYASFEEWVQSKPELKNFFQFMIDDSDAKLKESQRKERREAAGIALGNLMRAFTNLYYTTQGSPNAYNNEEADKVTEGVHTHYDRWRKQLDDNRKERWEQYQKLRNQYAQERQQAHKEAMDTENLKLAKEKNLREALKNDAQLELIYQQASKAKQDAIKAAIDAGDEAELNRLKREEIESRTIKNKTSAANETKKTDSTVALNKQKGAKIDRETKHIDWKEQHGDDNDTPAVLGGGMSIADLM